MAITPKARPIQSVANPELKGVFIERIHDQRSEME
jgi:hypothetical protein